MSSRTLYVEAIAFWAPTLPGWQAAKAAFQGEAAPLASPVRIPPPMALPPSERRRAPETVALALAAGGAAIQASGRDARELLAVFTSAHGDLPVIDQICHTLAHNPLLVSPTRFLHSIHNAPAAYWSMLASNGLNHTAVSAAEFSFAAGFLEAAVMAETEQRPVLLVGYDTEATGALTQTTHSRGAIAVALMLHAQRTPQSTNMLQWQVSAPTQAASAASSIAAQGLAPNGMSPAVPLFEALAKEAPGELRLALSAHRSLRLTLHNLTDSARS